MLIVDRALSDRCASKNPIRVGLVGAGFSARHIARQIVRSVPGLRLVAIANRTMTTAEEILRRCGVERVRRVDSTDQLEAVIASDQFAITHDASVLCQAQGIDAIIESTGTVEFGARVVLGAIAGGKHVILLNAELDATLGPILYAEAARAGVIYTNSDGDEPGVAMNLYRYIQSLGLRPVVAGNLKGLYDPYRNPETQQQFARQHNQKPAAVASFADGTKLSMELAVLANATGFGVGKRGMFGPSLPHVKDSPKFFHDKIDFSTKQGIVDFLQGAEPANGAFVLAHTDDRDRQSYLKYLKMGDGPLYVFYTPFHLPQWEVPLTVARAVLFHDAAVAPQTGHVCDVIAVAKRDLQPGDLLDGFGGFCCYGLLEAAPLAVRESLLPMGVSAGCRVKRRIARDEVIRHDDVALPEGRLCDELRNRLCEHFHRQV